MSQLGKTRLYALGMLLLANAFWGLSFPLIKALILLSTQLSPGSGLFALACTIAPRFIVGTILLLLWQLILTPKDQKPWLTKIELTQGIYLGILGAVGMLLQNDGLRFTTASTSAFLTQFSALLIPLWLALRSRTLPNIMIIISSVFVLAGVSILGNFDYKTLHFGRGEFETLLCSVFFMAQVFGVENETHLECRHEKVTLVWLGTEALLFTGLGLHSAPKIQDFFIPWNSMPWLGLTLALTLFPTLGSFSIMSKWQSRITATEAGLIYCFEPIFGSLFALFLPAIFSLWAGINYPNEHITQRLLIGGCLITFANALIQLSPIPKSRGLPM
jgi:drug/metabolite transporter (DMT)-like permease